MYSILINDGLWHKDDGKNTFESLDEIKDLFEGLGVEMLKLEDEDGEEQEVSLGGGITELLECGSRGDCAQVCNEELCEMGDDYAEMSIVEIT